ncbi:hypothetical protein TNCV_1048801 [Trichonephila clavipes]|nr:hypothetical protein TNCV_1048801 [Trichonephila clavipes]
MDVDDIPHIQRSVMRLLNSTPQKDVLQRFQDMYSRLQLCIAMRGDYFEGQYECCIMRSDGLLCCVSDGLWFLLRWIDGTTSAPRRLRSFNAHPGSPMKEIRTRYLPFRKHIT